MAAAVASPLVGAVAPAKSADFDYLRYQDKIKEYVVKARFSPGYAYAKEQSSCQRPLEQTAVSM